MTPANISDTERREIARKLRKCTPPTSYRQAEGGGWAHLCDMAFVVGFKLADNPTAWEFAQRLADLIEPNCDRDALMELADDLEAQQANKGLRQMGPYMQPGDAANRIREALGVDE